jgi:hypothetical protein
MMNQSGGSPKTEIRSAKDFLTAITADETIKTVEPLNSFVDQERKLFSEHGQVTLSLCGDVLRMTAGSKESIVQYSETKAEFVQVSLSDKLTPSLISAGLVCGIIPLSMRDASGQQTLDSVLKPPAGNAAVKQKVD